MEKSPDSPTKVNAMILVVIFVVLMMFWLFYGGWSTYNGPNPNPIAFGGTIIPWLCVAILGWVLFGGGSIVVR